MYQCFSHSHDRIQLLFEGGVVCKEEVGQIKNVYSRKLYKCLTELMSLPEETWIKLDRSNRVKCMRLGNEGNACVAHNNGVFRSLRELRISIEDRRGSLLMKEVEDRIYQYHEEKPVVRPGFQVHTDTGLSKRQQIMAFPWILCTQFN